ncbi:glycosyltransferase involved in cell wall biosynthesis [Labedella gwakjiensis]|uniref:Glycosyltransferase family 1 protein n=1 Tax=Labedella gwakjiensis TaxID=390269 RepID=A0A2P8GXS6_9MICO|nr:glycosyltransferase family 1 protein [Labedella gwakjiensis]PSL38772.1 glycosyltransferase involved in cell wall biosynthesis [Labedella gwakjiensis]RUQ86749.1 glycosyltransferase family 1 protein [Labedella gwakjiensis]
MNVVLRVVVDHLATPVPTGIGRYTRELTRGLIETAPPRCAVEGIVSALPPEKIDDLESQLPGLAELHRTTLPRRELAAAWQLGIAPTLANGMIHAPGLLAPLVKHETASDGTQIVVTVHDTLAWTHAKSLTPATVAWNRAMLKRARKHADAIVVPSHAVAERLADIVDLGDRVRVIGGAASEDLVVPGDADARTERLGLPPEYLLTIGTLDPRRGLTDLITALGLPGAPDLPLLILGPDTWGELAVATVADEAGLPEGRVRALGVVDDADLAVLLDRATLFVHPGRQEGFGLPIIEAFRFGTPVVHSDDAALVEVAGGAGVAVELDGKGYPERLAAAISSTLSDPERLRRLGVLAADRERAFSWRDSAERVWQLHADL